MWFMGEGPGASTVITRCHASKFAHAANLECAAFEVVGYGCLPMRVLHKAVAHRTVTRAFRDDTPIKKKPLTLTKKSCWWKKGCGWLTTSWAGLPNDDTKSLTPPKMVGQQQKMKNHDLLPTLGQRKIYSIFVPSKGGGWVPLTTLPVRETQPTLTHTHLPSPP